MTNHRRGLWSALLAVALGVLLLVFITRVSQTADLAAEIHETQVANGRTLDNSSQTLRVIEDCTQPTGACYRDAQRRTGAAVAAINRVILIAAACSANLPRMSVAERRDRIQRCVTNQLERRGP